MNIAIPFHELSVPQPISRKVELQRNGDYSSYGVMALVLAVFFSELILAWPR